MVTAETSVYKIEWIECCSMRTQSGITQDKKHELLHRNFITADLFRMASAELATLIRYIIYHNNALEYLIIFQLIMCGLFSSFNFQICLLSSVAFFLFLLRKERAWLGQRFKSVLGKTNVLQFHLFVQCLRICIQLIRKGCLFKKLKP